MPVLERSDRYLDLARTSRSWQLVAFFLLAAHVVLGTAFTRLALSSRLVPYVVHVDPDGRATFGGTVARVDLPEEHLVVAELHRFLWSLRVVVTDPVAQHELIARAYAVADVPLRRRLDLHFLTPETDPRKIAARASRAVDRITILPMPGTDGTFELSWREVEIDRLAYGASTERTFRGLLTVTTVRLETAESLVSNPLGLLVTDFQWTETTPNS